MQTENHQNAVLVLEDGTVFNGKAAGVIGQTSGEIAFNTGMYGYQEIFTDPSYLGQILIMTTSHIGNYGVHPDEVESDGLKIAGIVSKKFSEIYSRTAGNASLQDYLEKDGVVAICDVDTRALVRYIRERGAMNAIICSDGTPIEELQEAVKQVPSMEGLELSSKVSTKEIYQVGDQNATLKVALLDLGVKTNIIRCLTERGCHVTVYPMNTATADIIASKPDGIMLSNGPGDPQVMLDTIANVKTLIDAGIPVFGICLGHQVIALSQGLKTEKMFNGHRGVNHPIKNLETGKCEVTSQNHGFVVNREEAEKREDIVVTHLHLNDGTLAGIRLNNRPVFSVQYHPEASAGPHDSRYLFDTFVENMKKHLN
ncbi:MAG: glutamine-hydrolyzing carbamoyl-phosphate synthase small subunit [Flavobacteriaceae bacterium]|nr:glutamine-hydrolyzing carbamoyl-phosphate synthase small subunit [Flavobacteriaceae bacterium]